MRPQPDELQCLVIRLAMDQDQVWPDVAVMMVLPIAGQRVIRMARIERLSTCRMAFSMMFKPLPFHPMAPF